MDSACPAAGVFRIQIGLSVQHHELTQSIKYPVILIVLQSQNHYEEHFNLAQNNALIGQTNASSCGHVVN